MTPDGFIILGDDDGQDVRDRLAARARTRAAQRVSPIGDTRDDRPRDVPARQDAFLSGDDPLPGWTLSR